MPSKLATRIVFALVALTVAEARYTLHTMQTKLDNLTASMVRLEAIHHLGPIAQKQ